MTVTETSNQRDGILASIAKNLSASVSSSRKSKYRDDIERLIIDLFDTIDIERPNPREAILNRVAILNRESILNGGAVLNMKITKRTLREDIQSKNKDRDDLEAFCSDPQSLIHHEDTSMDHEELDPPEHLLTKNQKRRKR